MNSPSNSSLLNPFDDNDLLSLMSQRDDASFDPLTQFDWNIRTPEKPLWADSQVFYQSNIKNASPPSKFITQHNMMEANSAVDNFLRESANDLNEDWMSSFDELEGDENFDQDVREFCDGDTFESTEAFLHNYNETVNHSIEYEINDDAYTQLTRNCTSPLYESLVENATTLDDLDVGDKADGTYAATYTAIKSFNFWWMNHTFLPQNTQLYAVKFKYGDMVDGFQALCSASHQERNILFSHYVTKMVKRKLTKKDAENEITFVLGRTKRGYLNSLMRGLKMYEHHHGLTDIYGVDWSWTSDLAYKQTFAALKKVTKKNELSVSPDKVDHSAAYLTDEQLHVLQEFTWDLSEDTNLPFSQRLKHKAAYFCQGCATFDCLKGRDELANMLTNEFKILPCRENILFQMKRDFKSSGKLDADMKPVHKPSLVLPGERYVHILEKYLLSHRPSNLPHHTDGRLLLRPNDVAQPSHDTWYGKRVLGKDFTDKIVSFYVQQLRELNHPLFEGNQKFTNSSLRKFHLDKLAEANAPLKVQQASLAQNTKHYSRAADTLSRKMKVAQIVSGKRKSWHDSAPPLSNNIPPKSTALSMHRSPTTPCGDITNIPVKVSANTSGSKRLSFSFKAPNANFEFSYDL